METEKVNRVEVIDEDGRSYVKYAVKNVDMSVQDDGLTLKIFLEVGDETEQLLGSKANADALAESIKQMKDGNITT